MQTLPALRNVLGAACVGGVGAALLLRSEAEAAEEKVALDKLPPAVMAAVKKAVPNARWVQATKDDEDGEVSYEVIGVIDNKRLVTVELDADGNIDEVNTQVDLKDVPKVVLTALKEKEPRAKIVVAFEVRDKDGKLTEYEFDCTRPRAAKGKGKGKKGKARGDEDITITVSADGKTVEVEGEDD